MRIRSGYPRPAVNPNQSKVQRGNVSRWSWRWWKARPKAACGANAWNAITTWGAACHSARTCAYWVRNGQRELACLLWTSPAWKMQARDAWIGWSEEQRQRHLQLIINNGRFLILPWVQVKGLASKILALSARQLPSDWHCHYGHRPLLLESLVHRPVSSL